MRESRPSSRLLPTIVAWALLCTGLLGSLVASAQGGSRHALVIGNAEYGTLADLVTTANDAKDVAEALRELGFEVTLLSDKGLAEMREAVNGFVDRIGDDASDDGLYLLYFAGYGIGYQGKNYLLPVDFDKKLRKKKLAERALAFPADLVCEGKCAKRSSGPTKLIVLDASRKHGLDRRTGFLQITEDRLPGRTLIVFSAQPGKLSDLTEETNDKVPAKDRRSPFSKRMIEAMLEDSSASLDVVQLFESVKKRVEGGTANQQGPRLTGALSIDKGVSLRAGAAATSAPASGTDEAAFLAAEAAGRLCAYRRYADRYPDGKRIDEAREIIEVLEDDRAKHLESINDGPAKLRKKRKAMARKRQREDDAWCETNLARREADAPRWVASAPSTLPEASAIRIVDELAARSLRGARYPRGADADSIRIPGTRVGYERFVGRFAGAVRPAIWAERGDSWLRPRAIRLVQTRKSVAKTTPGDDLRSFHSTLDLAQRGNLDAMYQLALIYERGTPDVPRDVDEMLHWLSLSSALGNGQASYKLAALFENSFGDAEAAATFRELALEQGFSPRSGESALAH